MEQGGSSKGHEIEVDARKKPQQVTGDGKSVEEGSLQPEEQPTCAACGGSISAEDLVCPHCGESLAGG